MKPLSAIPFEPHPFTSLAGSIPPEAGLTEELYKKQIERLKAQKDIDVSRITYDSDRLKITGVRVLPKLLPGQKVPMIIYNRGGNREFGKLTVGQILGYMIPLIKAFPAGVLATNYRGNDGGEGKEELGGDDVHDVLNLIEAGKKEPWWDGRNIFMIGGSRGAMMTYLAIKHGAPLNAAAAWAGPTDLFAAGKERPEMEENVYARLIPGWPESREEAYRERSAQFWPEKLNVPLLILHGDADWRVDVRHSRDLAAKLKEQGKPVSYKEFPGGDHGLTQHRGEMIQTIADWFSSHMKQKAAPSRG